MVAKAFRTAPFSPDTASSLRASMQSQGVKVYGPAEARRGGAGPAEGTTLLLQGSPVNVPTQGSFVAESPFSIHPMKGSPMLFKNESPVCKVAFPVTPRYYSLATKEGIPYRKIALLHGVDCLASTVWQNCIYWNSPLRCRFCGIEISLMSNTTIARKTPQQLAEVAKAAQTLDRVQHVTLTTGTQEDTSEEFRYLASCCAAIKNETDLPIHIQCMPPRDMSHLELLKRSGADTLGMHIESFDPVVLENNVPCKASLGLHTYLTAWKEAISIFGKNQVSSFVIIGLGEQPSPTLEGIAQLCELGVYPLIVPLRPIPGTPLADCRPPALSNIIPLYQYTASLLKQHHLSLRNSKAGCVRCSACTALPDFEMG